MESSIVCQQLNNPNDPDARRALICYLQYLMDYHRDVPAVENYIVNELQGLRSTKYVRQLQESDPIFHVLHSSEKLNVGEQEANKLVWRQLRNSIINL